MLGSKVWGTVVLAGLVGAVSTAGCSCGDSNGTGGGSPSSGSNMGGGGPGGGSQGNGMIKSSTLASSQLAFDATLSDDASIVYFTGVTASGDGAVYSVPVSGGTPEVVAKSGLIAPLGIALSSDGKTLYVADPGAASSKEDGGAILSVKAEGGTPSVLSGSEGAVPRSLDVSGSSIFFSGSVKGVPGVYKMSTAGGAINDVANGASFIDPAGVAVAKDGTVYVVDTIGGSHHDATVFAISKGKLSTILPHGYVGYPAGIALAQDEKTLLVSGLRDIGAYSAVLEVDIDSHEIVYFPADGKKSDFTALFEPGGLHRGRDRDTFAWVVADTMGGGVFILK